MDKLTLLTTLKRIYHKTVDIEDFEAFKKLPQTDKIWWHLLNFGSITVSLARALYGVHYCTSAIRNIRRNLELYSDSTRYIESVLSKGIDRWGNKSEFITYTLRSAA